MAIDRSWIKKLCFWKSFRHTSIIPSDQNDFLCAMEKGIKENLIPHNDARTIYIVWTNHSLENVQWSHKNILIHSELKQHVIYGNTYHLYLIFSCSLLATLHPSTILQLGKLFKKYIAESRFSGVILSLSSTDTIEKKYIESTLQHLSLCTKAFKRIAPLHLLQLSNEKDIALFPIQKQTDQTTSTMQSIQDHCNKWHETILNRLTYTLTQAKDLHQRHMHIHHIMRGEQYIAQTLSLVEKIIHYLASHKTLKFLAFFKIKSLEECLDTDFLFCQSPSNHFVKYVKRYWSFSWTHYIFWSIVIFTFGCICQAKTHNALARYQHSVHMAELYQNTLRQPFIESNGGLALSLSMFRYQKTYLSHSASGLSPDDKINLPFMRLLEIGLTDSFLPYLFQKLEEHLRLFDMQWPYFSKVERHKIEQDYYLTLKTYLMLYAPNHMDPLLGALILKPLVTSLFSGSDQYAITIHDFLSWYLSSFSNNTAIQVLPNATLIQKSRENLHEISDAYDIYIHIRNQGFSKGNVNLNTLIGYPYAPYFRSFNIFPLFYTKEGFKTIFLPALKKMLLHGSDQNWVITTPLDLLRTDMLSDPFKNIPLQKNISAVRKTILHLYAEDYLTTWEKTITRIELKSEKNLTEHSKQLSKISEHSGAWIAWILTVYDQLGVIADQQETARQIRSALGGSRYWSFSKKVKQYVTCIHHLSNDIGQLDQMSARALAFNVFSGHAQTTTLVACAQSGQKVVQSVSDPKARYLLDTVLGMPLRSVWKHILQETAQAVDALWQPVWTAYQQTLFPYEPFSNTTQSAALTAITAWFHPQFGLFPQYMRNIALPLLYWDGFRFIPRTWLGIGMAFTPQALIAFQKNTAISTLLFNAGNQTPSMVIHIYPEPSPYLNGLSIQFNGAYYRYANGPQEWQTFNWPSTHPEDEISIEGLIRSGEHTTSVDAAGLWGIFKLLRQSHYTIDRNGECLAQWFIKDRGHPITLSLKIKTSFGNICDTFGQAILPVPRSLLMGHPE